MFFVAKFKIKLIGKNIAEIKSENNTYLIPTPNIFETFHSGIEAFGLKIFELVKEKAYPQ